MDEVRKALDFGRFTESNGDAASNLTDPRTSPRIWGEHYGMASEGYSVSQNFGPACL